MSSETPAGADPDRDGDAVRRRGAVNEPAVAALTRHLVDHGSDGVVVAGTTGEAATLDDEEKLRLFETAVDEVGGRGTVVAGTGSNDTAHSVRLTREAAARGVDAVLVVTPYYNKPNGRGLRAHFAGCRGGRGRRADAALQHPRPVRDQPRAGSAGRALEDRQRRWRQAGELRHGAARRIVEDSELALLAGDDNLLCPFAEIGGAGGITVSSHLAGERMKEVFEAASAGDTERARSLDAELEDLYRTLFIAPAPATVKAALGELGFDLGGVRLPLVEVDAAELEELRRMLAALSRL